MKHIKLFEAQSVQKTYSWDELSPEAKAHAIDNNRDINTDTVDWHSDTLYDWEERLKEAGIGTPQIMYSGFWSQGDGASFTGDVSSTEGVKKLVRDTLNMEYPNEVLDCLNIQIVRTTSHYYHENTVEAEVEYDHEDDEIDYMPFGPEVPFHYDLEEVCQEIEAKLEEWLKATCRQIYRDLEDEYESLQSDEAVEDALIANDYEYNEKGDIV